MLLIGMLSMMLGLQGAHHPPLLPRVGKLVLPIYPKLAKSAHDSRTVVVKIHTSGNGVAISEIVGGNKYFEGSIKKAIAAWILSNQQGESDSDFTLTFQFKMTEEPEKEGMCEVYLEEDRIVVWGLKHFTDTEKLPVMTRPSKTN